MGAGPDRDNLRRSKRRCQPHRLQQSPSFDTDDLPETLRQNIAYGYHPTMGPLGLIGPCSVTQLMVHMGECELGHISALFQPQDARFRAQPGHLALGQLARRRDGAPDHFLAVVFAP